MTGFRAVAWDIDGTLVDSEPLHQRALQQTCAALGVDLSDLADDTFRGIHMHDVWEALKPRFPESVSRDAWLAAVERFYVEHASEVTPSRDAVAESPSALLDLDRPAPRVSSAGLCDYFSP